MESLIIFGAKYLVYIVAVLAVLVALFDKERRSSLAVLALLALALGYMLARVAGLFFSHQQPFAAGGFEPLIPHAVDNAFPSDHVLVGGIFASLALLVERRFGLVLWALTLLVGLSRMLAGLHYGVDVLAAAALAVLVIWVAYTVVWTYPTRGVGKG